MNFWDFCTWTSIMVGVVFVAAFAYHSWCAWLEYKLEEEKLHSDSELNLARMYREVNNTGGVGERDTTQA